MTEIEIIIGSIQPLDEQIQAKAIQRLDQLIKPKGSLGTLEKIAIQLAGIQGTSRPKIYKKCTIVMASDNGIVEEKVASAPQVVTLSQTLSILNGLAGINALSKQAGADVKVVDVGIAKEIHHSSLISRKIRKGTSNMCKGPAMSYEEAQQGIKVGMDMVKSVIEEGYNVIGTGEMGIGNTSTSSAMIISFTGCSVEKAVGKGAGLTEDGYEHKKKVISQVLKVNQPNRNDPIDVLSKVGGFDIAGLVGCYLGAAYYRVPIVMDGVISATAALTAYYLNPLVKEYIIPSHDSVEPGYTLICQIMGLQPMLHMNMRLGEGTGCPLAFHLIESACAMINDMATFEEVALNSDFLIEF